MVGQKVKFDAVLNEYHHHTDEQNIPAEKFSKCDAIKCFLIMKKLAHVI